MSSQVYDIRYLFYLAAAVIALTAVIFLLRRPFRRYPASDTAGAATEPLVPAYDAEREKMTETQTIEIPASSHSGFRITEKIIVIHNGKSAES